MKKQGDFDIMEKGEDNVYKRTNETIQYIGYENL